MTGIKKDAPPRASNTKNLDTKQTNILLKDDVVHYLPQTPMDSEQLVVWIAKGLSPSQIEIKMQDPEWRSETEEFRGHPFCCKCGQLASKDNCEECGQPIPGLLPKAIDVIPVPSEVRRDLEKTAEELMRTSLSPRVVIEFLHFRSQSLRPLLEPTDVDMIFGEAAAKELIRRKGGTHVAG